MYIYLYRLTRICRIHAKSCIFLIFYLNQKCFLESNNGCGDYFYKSEIPEVQINLHFGYFELVKLVPTTSIYRNLTVDLVPVRPFQIMSVLVKQPVQFVYKNGSVISIMIIVLKVIKRCVNRQTILQKAFRLHA